MASDATLNGHTISEEKAVELPQQWPVLSDQPGVRTLKVSADLLDEYVGVGDGFSAFTLGSIMGGAYLKQLPNPSDELMLSFGSRLYDEDMMHDPQINSVVSVLVMGLLCQGVTYQNPIKQGEDGYDQAEKILAFCNYCIENLRHPMPSIRYELAEGMIKMGHKVGEMIYDLHDPIAGDYSGEQIVLTDIKPKAHSATAFVMDGYSNVIGLAYVKPNETLPLMGSTIMSDPSATASVDNTSPEQKLRVIPRSKFVIPVHKPKNGDPRGTSHLQSVYTPWWKKQQLNPQHMAYVARFAQPSVWAKLPPEAKDIPVYNQDNQIISYKSIIASTTAALAKIKGGAVASFIDTDVNMLEATGDAKVLFESYEHEDRQIAKGILLQTLTTEESRHMARAASNTHQDVFGILLQFLRDTLEWTERNDILRPLVMYNYGEDAAKRFTPTVSYGEVQVQDIPSFMGALAQLSLAGGVHPSMWPAIRDMIGLPAADPVAEAKDLKMEQDMKQLQANPPIPGQVPGDPQTKPGQPNDPQSPKRGTNATAPAKGAGNNAMPMMNPPASNPMRRANTNG